MTTKKPLTAEEEVILAAFRAGQASALKKKPAAAAEAPSEVEVSEPKKRKKRGGPKVSPTHADNVLARGRDVPAGGTRPVQVMRRGPRAQSPAHQAPKPGVVEVRRIDDKWKETITTCTKCGHTGPVDPDFGVRVVRGLEHKQSWCITCRATTSYYRTKR